MKAFFQNSGGGETSEHAHKIRGIEYLKYYTHHLTHHKTLSFNNILNHYLMLYVYGRLL